MKVFDTDGKHLVKGLQGPTGSSRPVDVVGIFRGISPRSAVIYSRGWHKWAG